MDATTYILLVAIAASLIFSWYAMPSVWAKLLLKASRRAAGLRSRNCIIDNTRWHYLEGGSGPILLLIHGFGADADNWLLVARRLARHFHIIAPDLPGFGCSSPGNQLSFKVQDQASRLVQFMDQVGHSPSYIAGSSMGGWIAATLARHHYQRLKGLWLIAPLGVAGSNQSEMQRAIESGRASPIHLENIDDFERQVYNPMFVKPPPLPFPLKRFYALRAVKRSPRAVQQFKQVLLSPDSLEQTLHGIRVPVLLQWGDGDRAVDISGAKILEQTVPGAKVVLQPQVGHLPMLETPDQSCQSFLVFTHTTAA
ncbi:MAG: alpha/beta hydrolase [Xanthomonadales bacterium]|nr:alpha/beta hydrolase [Xanthomonadales bacterium]